MIIIQTGHIIMIVPYKTYGTKTADNDARLIWFNALSGKLKKQVIKFRY